MRRAAALLAAALLLAPPARARGEGEGEEAVPSLLPLGGLLLFYKTSGPLSAVALTPGGLPPGARPLGTVRGRSCQRGLSIPLAAQLGAASVSGGYGDGSLSRAAAAALSGAPGAEGLYDVREDLRVFSVLGLYRSLCTEVTARAYSRS